MSRMQFSVNSIVKNYYINIVLYNRLKFLYFISVNEIKKYLDFVDTKYGKHYLKQLAIKK